MNLRLLWREEKSQVVWKGRNLDRIFWVLGSAGRRGDRLTDLDDSSSLLLVWCSGGNVCWIMTKFKWQRKIQLQKWPDCFCLVYGKVEGQNAEMREELLPGSVGDFLSCVLCVCWAEHFVTPNVSTFFPVIYSQRHIRMTLIGQNMKSVWLASCLYDKQCTGVKKTMLIWSNSSLIQFFCFWRICSTEWLNCASVSLGAGAGVGGDFSAFP